MHTTKKNTKPYYLVKYVLLAPTYDQFTDRSTSRWFPATHSAQTQIIWNWPDRFTFPKGKKEQIYRYTDRQATISNYVIFGRKQNSNQVATCMRLVLILSDSMTRANDCQWFSDQIFLFSSTTITHSHSESQHVHITCDGCTVFRASEHSSSRFEGTEKRRWWYTRK